MIGHLVLWDDLFQKLKFEYMNKNLGIPKNIYIIWMQYKIMTEKHLPIFGVAPYLISSIALITSFALAADYLKIIPTHTITPIKPIFVIMGILLIIIGIILVIGSN